MTLLATAEQELLGATVRGFLAERLVVRAAWSGDGRSRELWLGLADIGVAGALVPEEYGGLGLAPAELVRVLEEAGRAALPEPLLESAFVGAPLLAESGTDEQRERWLPSVATGQAILTLALEEQPLVPDAHYADLILLERGGELHALPREDVRLTAQPSVDGARRLFSVEAVLSADTRLPGGRGSAFERGALGNAARLVGVGARLLEDSVAYALERHQFGRAIGSFQAIKHRLADVLLGLELARPAVTAAADGLDPLAVSVACVAAIDAERRANLAALQVHGGVGFTWEHDLHLWLKHGLALERAWGTADWHRRRVASLAAAASHRA